MCSLFELLHTQAAGPTIQNSCHAMMVTKVFLFTLDHFLPAATPQIFKFPYNFSQANQSDPALQWPLTG